MYTPIKKALLVLIIFSLLLPVPAGLAQTDDSLVSEVEAKAAEQQLLKWMMQKIKDQAVESKVQATLDGLGEELKKQLRAELKEELKAQLTAQLTAQLKTQLLEELKNELRAELKKEIKTRLTDQLRAQLREELKEQIRGEVIAQLTDAGIEEIQIRGNTLISTAELLADWQKKLRQNT